MDRKTVPSRKLLTFVRRAATSGKTRSSPACGATSPTQLAGVVQLLSAPPPSQVATAGAVRSSSRVRKSGRRAVHFLRRRDTVGLRFVERPFEASGHYQGGMTNDLP